MSGSETFTHLRPAARRLGVPVAWLRREAEAGTVPALRVGRRLMIDVEAVERVLLERANGSDLFVSPRQAAQVLGISEALIRHEVVRGRIPALTDGERILVTVDAVRVALLKADGGDP